MEEQVKEELRRFPKNTKADIKSANALFKHYIFFERSGRLWTSCCNQAARKMPKSQALGHHREQGACPFCGATATWYGKQYGKKTLTEYEPCLFLHKRGTVVFGDAVWMKKEYTHALTPKIEFGSTYAYRFERRNPRMFQNYDWCEVTNWFEHRNAPFREKWSVPSFHVIGMERLKGTCLEYAPVNYCNTRYRNKFLDLPKLLMLYCLYPQIEMLYKMRFSFFIRDLMRGVRNKEIIDWTQTDPRRALGMDGGELRVLAALNAPDTDVLRLRKRILRHGHKITVAEASAILEFCGRGNREWVVISKIVRLSGYAPQKVIKYLEKQIPQCVYAAGAFGISQIMEYYRDYITFCMDLKYDLRDPLVLMPPDLHAAHDRAAEICAAIREEKSLEKEKKRRDALNKRYGFEAAGYRIRAPIDVAEIIAEGKVLRHCVGGYADRHMSGKATILFLRAQNAPEKPLATIEMNGNCLVQVHGYRNEWERCAANPYRIPPKQLYAEILNPWLQWVAAGSKRDTDGQPVLKISKRRTA